MTSKYHSVLRAELNRIEYENQIIPNIGEQLPRFSSGCLVNDLVIGGGVPPCMMTYSGHEGGGKTTLLNHTINSAIKSNIQTIIYFDAENARDPEYVANIYREHKFEEIFGVPGGKAGEWLIPPLVNYYPYSQFERVFGAFKAILNVLPDKIYRQSDKTWYYVFRNKREELKRLKDMGLTVDKRLSNRKQYWCPTDDAGIQALLAVDSWVALILESQEEDENDKQGIAPEARQFPPQIRKIKGRLARKQATLLGINQLRTNPMAGRFGNPDYEPGGSALRYFSDIRSGLRPVVPREGFVRDKEARGLSLEPSVMGSGEDRYAFKSITNIKNKYGRPLLKGQMRIWVSDINGQAHGVDPVFDLYQYFRMTGQLTGTIKSGLKLNFKPFNVKRKIPWLEFKELVLAQHFADRKSERASLKKLKLNKRIKLREFCVKQLLSGKALELFQQQQTKVKDTEEVPDYNESSD